MNYLHYPNTEGNLLPKYKYLIPTNYEPKICGVRMCGIVNDRILYLDYNLDNARRREVTILNESDLSPIEIENILASEIPFFNKNIIYFHDESESVLRLYDTNINKVIDRVSLSGVSCLGRHISSKKILLIIRRGGKINSPQSIGVFDFSRHTMKWELEPESLRHEAWYDSNVYIFLGREKGLFSLTLETGEVVWKKNFTNWDMEAYRPRANYRFNVRDEIYVYKDLVLVNLELGLLLAINRHTGERAWIVENVTGFTFIVSQEGLVYSILGDKLNILSAETGQMVKQFTLADPDIQESLHSHYFVVTSIRLTTTHIWAVFFGAKSAASLLVAINPETGEIEWKKGFTPAVSGNPMFVNNRMYFCTVNLSIGAEDPRKDYIIEGEGGYIPG